MNLGAQGRYTVLLGEKVRGGDSRVISSDQVKCTGSGCRLQAKWKNLASYSLNRPRWQQARSALPRLPTKG